MAPLLPTGRSRDLYEVASNHSDGAQHHQIGRNLRHEAFRLITRAGEPFHSGEPPGTATLQRQAWVERLRIRFLCGFTQSLFLTVSERMAYHWEAELPVAERLGSTLYRERGDNR